MDADDIMATTRIEAEVNEFINNPNIDVCGCSAMLIDENNSIIGSQNMEGVTDFFIHPSVMGKTEWFKKYKYREWAKRIEDRDLWYRAKPSSCFYNIPSPLLFYRAFGTPTANQHLESDKRLRQIYWHYKDYKKTLVWCLINCLKTYIKDLIFSISSAFKMKSIQKKIRTRNSVPTHLALGKDALENSIFDDESRTISIDNNSILQQQGYD